MENKQQVPHNQQHVKAASITDKRRKSGILQWLGNRELSVLIALFAIMAAFWGFAELTEAVLDGDTRAIDRAILLSMRNPSDLTDPIGAAWVEEIGRDFTALGGTAVLTLITLAVVGYLMLEGKGRIALVLIIATLGALGVSHTLKKVIDRDRPDLVPHGSTTYTASFPSGHSMLSASTYLTMGALLARVQRRKRLRAYILLTAITTTLLVGISRVYLGVHWPTDVLAGWTAGAGWALMCWLLARWLQRHGVINNRSENENENEQS